jgi:hypothetical protein
MSEYSLKLAEYLGCKITIDPTLPENIAVIETGKETAIFRVDDEGVTKIPPAPSSRSLTDE